MTNRGMIKRTFESKGIEYASELALLNVRDLLKILQWNESHEIRFFRVSSDLFPWMSHYELSQLPNFDKIQQALHDVGVFASANKHRITFHPGPFNKLASPDDNVVTKTIKELNQHSEVFDLMGFDPSPYNKINIHVGGAYGDKKETAQRFCKNFSSLSESTQKRLTVENDDRASLFSTKDLYDLVYQHIGIPIVHDFHHHGFQTGNLTQKEALGLAVTTWGSVKPVTHYSESRSKEKNDPKIKDNAHSDFVNGPIETFDFDIDVMIEAKMKEKALQQLNKATNI